MDEANLLLDTLFGNAPRGYFVEIRRFGGYGGAQQSFLPTGQPWRLAAEWDGTTNVYYGVSLRSRRGGTAEDVSQAVALWVDDPQLPIPEGFPGPSVEVETSTRKFQLEWLLEQPTDDLDRVEELNRRLTHILAADNVGDRARVLRLPGYLNIKPEHPEHPRARIHSLDGATFTLNHLEALLPPIEGKRMNSRHDGPFRPHKGDPMPDSIRDELRAVFPSLGLSIQHDGRWTGPCPFPHNQGICTCERAFYVSDITGQYSCFCSGHEGRSPGDGRRTASGGIGTLLRLVRGLPASPMPHTIGSRSHTRRFLYVPEVTL